MFFGTLFLRVFHFNYHTMWFMTSIHARIILRDMPKRGITPPKHEEQKNADMGVSKDQWSLVGIP